MASASDALGPRCRPHPTGRSRRMISPPPRARASGLVLLIHELGERSFQSNLVRRRLLALMRRARSRRCGSGTRDHGGLRKRGAWRARGRLAGGGNQGGGSRERQLELGTTTRKPAPTIRIVSLRLGTNASITKRLWILHPKYLDVSGLVSTRRETLLAQAVLRGETKDYRSHPQLRRFRNLIAPVRVIIFYIHHVHSDAVIRGHRLDHLLGSGRQTDRGARREARIRMAPPGGTAEVAESQTNAVQLATAAPVPHTLFRVVPGDASPWERGD